MSTKKEIPTAEEFWNMCCQNDTLKSPGDIMIEFTKLHVKAALERAYQNQGMSWTNSKDEEVKMELFIKNSYPLTKIR